MLSNRPYLLRAFYQWINDSDLTPILVIAADHPRCKIPQEYVEDGEIVFNISTSAVRDLVIANDLISFKASFSGVIHLISAPINAVLAIYAEENGEGIFLDAEEEADESKHGKSGHIQLQSIDGKKLQPDNKEAIETDLHQGKNVKSKPFLRLVE